MKKATMISSVVATAVLAWASFTSARPSANGIISVLTHQHIIHQPYPTGSRRTDSRADPGKHYQCTQCDPGAPTELCFPEFDACAKLSDSAVTIFRTTGVESTSMSLNPKCHPRSFQRLTYVGLHISIECHNYTSQIVGLQKNNMGDITMTLHNPNGWTVQNEIVVEGTGISGGTEVYHVEIDHDILYRSNFHAGNLVDITPPNVLGCDRFLSLFNLYTRNKFLLWCDTNSENGKRIYAIDVNHDFTEDILAPYIASNSPPLSSPNGQTFVTVANATLRAYRSNNLSTQPPGARNFGSRITFYTYVDDNTLLLVLEGQTQTLVNMTLFIDSSGTNGITPLSSATVNAKLHKSIMGGAYVTYNKSGTLYNLLMYTTDGQLINTFPNFASQPDDVFFQEALPSSPLPSPPAVTDLVSVTMVETTLDSHLSPTPSLIQVTEATKQPEQRDLTYPIIATTVFLGLFIVFATALFIFLLVCIKKRRKSLGTHPAEESQNDQTNTHSSSILLNTFNEQMSVPAAEDTLHVFLDPIPETNFQA